MWVFGYGSLMWDGWEQKFDGVRHDKAILHNYRRAFNKKSVVNWGTTERPGPTLGLEREDGAKCIGCAFEIPDIVSDLAKAYLRKREGPGHILLSLSIVLEDGSTVSALTAVNITNDYYYIGGLSFRERAEMARVASGSSGHCMDYITGIQNKLAELGITDHGVNQMVNAL